MLLNNEYVQGMHFTVYKKIDGDIHCYCREHKIDITFKQNVYSFTFKKEVVLRIEGGSMHIEPAAFYRAKELNPLFIMLDMDLQIVKFKNKGYIIYL